LPERSHEQCDDHDARACSVRRRVGRVGWPIPAPRRLDTLFSSIVTVDNIVRLAQSAVTRTPAEAAFPFLHRAKAMLARVFMARMSKYAGPEPGTRGAGCESARGL
jgi:hypothetical protein